MVRQDKTATKNPQLGTGNWELATLLVGRQAELARLHAGLAKGQRGERQIIFVTGEAGGYRPLARAIHRRTDGNPLFMVTVVETLLGQSDLRQDDGQWHVKAALAVVEREVPMSLQQMIERQVERLSGEEQQVLAVGSVAGMTFAAALVAVGLETQGATAVVEECCERLARQGRFVEGMGVQEWPDGTVSGRYRFRHALYQQVMYERVATVRRVQWHREIDDPVLFVEAHHTLGVSLFYQGEIGAARDHFKQSLALYDAQSQRRYLRQYEFHPGVMGRCALTATLYLLGYPDQAERKSQEALTLAQELAYPHSMVFALSFAAELSRFRRQGRLTAERAEAARTLALERGLVEWVLQDTIWWGWALAEQGYEQDGIARMRQGLADYQAIGAEVGRANFLTVLAEGYGKAGEPHAGLRVLTEALTLIDHAGERCYEPEALRLKGELTLKQFGVRSSESENPQSPIPLWQRQGKTKEAHQMLAEMYGWFTEGFDTRELQEAKALLEELA